jgi:hypothetical protein
VDIDEELFDVISIFEALVGIPVATAAAKVGSAGAIISHNGLTTWRSLRAKYMARDHSLRPPKTNL